MKAAFGPVSVATGWITPTIHSIALLRLPGARFRNKCAHRIRSPHYAIFFGIPFYNHHNALADAVACAKLAMTLL